jgi:hypothetical protein
MEPRPMTFQYSFKVCLQRAERITWRVEDLIGEGKELDFSRPFLPESLARTAGLDFLTSVQKRTLNQIRGHAYLSIFGLVEEFILPFVIDHARPNLAADDYQARAYLEFAAEEAKHIQLFRRFAEAFAADFGSPCAVIGPPAAIAEHVLGHPPLSVALLTLHIEWMTQKHFQESVEGDEQIDPLFKNMLLHHWMEEHQHARLDTLMVQSLAAGLDAAGIQAGFDGYLALGAFLDEGLKQQTLLDMASLEQACGLVLDPAQREAFVEAQHQANRWTYIGSGMSHPNFLATLGELGAPFRLAIEQAAPAFS